MFNKLKKDLIGTFCIVNVIFKDKLVGIIGI